MIIDYSLQSFIFNGAYNLFILTILNTRITEKDYFAQLDV